MWPWKKAEERDATETINQTKRTFYDLSDTVIALCTMAKELEHTLKELADDTAPDDTA